MMLKLFMPSMLLVKQHKRLQKQSSVVRICQNELREVSHRLCMMTSRHLTPSVCRMKGQINLGVTKSPLRAMTTDGILSSMQTCSTGTTKPSVLMWSGLEAACCSPEKHATGMLLVGIAPRPDCHHNDDSNDDEKDDEAAAHPLASRLLILLSLDQFIHARLHMVSGLAHLVSRQMQ